MSHANTCLSSGHAQAHLRSQGPSDGAAILIARAEQAAFDPDIAIDELVKIDNAAQRAVDASVKHDSTAIVAVTFDRTPWARAWRLAFLRS
jgi:hypothetical protein